jgi:hypothetical protein
MDVSGICDKAGLMHFEYIQAFLLVLSDDLPLKKLK